MKGYVYILQSDGDHLYIGSTDNIARRLRQHAIGHTRTTARMKNVKPVLIQEYDSLLIARKVEMKIKRLKRKDYIKGMIRDGKITMLP